MEEVGCLLIIILKCHLGSVTQSLKRNGRDVLSVVGRRLLLGPPPDADHVVAGDGHHVLVIMATGHLNTDNQHSLPSDLYLSPYQ